MMRLEKRFVKEMRNEHMSLVIKPVWIISLKKEKKDGQKNPDSKLAHQISSAANETRVKRKSVQGMDIDEAINLRDSGALKVPNAKIK